jgi:tetratricopeptide (TPR) repeat protein
MEDSMNHHELWNELGNLYFMFGTYDRATRAYHKAIALDKDSGEPYNNLAQAYVRLGNYAEAVGFYQQGVSLLTDAREKAICLHKLGDTFLHLKKYSQAMEAYQQADDLILQFQFVIEGDNKQDLLLDCKPKGATLTASSSGAELAPLLEELTPWWFDEQPIPDEDLPDYELWLQDEIVIDDPHENVVFAEPLKWDLATVYQESIITTEAQNEMLQGEQAIADSTEPNTHVTEMLEATIITATIEETPSQVVQPAKHRRRRASKMDTVTADPEPLEVTVIMNEMEGLTNLSDFSSQSMTNIEAVQYETPVELPMAEISLEESARILIDIDRFKRALEINPKNASAWDSLGAQYKVLGQYDEAIHAFQKAVSLDYSKVSYRHHLGLVLAAVGRMDDAITAFERVIKIDPDHSLAHAALGGYYRRNGNEELAHVHIEKARSLLANDENEYNWACMEAICGNADRSLELLEIALKNSMHYVNWARKDPDLDFLRSDSRFPALLTKYATQLEQ